MSDDERMNIILERMNKIFYDLNIPMSPPEHVYVGPPVPHAGTRFDTASVLQKPRDDCWEIALKLQGSLVYLSDIGYGLDNESGGVRLFESSEEKDLEIERLRQIAAEEAGTGQES